MEMEKCGCIEDDNRPRSPPPCAESSGFSLEVNCGTNNAWMHLDKLKQGSKGACVLYGESWLTPNAFQMLSGRQTAKDWKRSIRHHGKTLKWLIANEVLSTETPMGCRCDKCHPECSIGTSETGIKQISDEKSADENSTTATIINHGISDGTPLVGNGTIVIAESLDKSKPSLFIDASTSAVNPDHTLIPRKENIEEDCRSKTEDHLAKLIVQQTRNLQQIQQLGKSTGMVAGKPHRSSGRSHKKKAAGEGKVLLGEKKLLDGAKVLKATERGNSAEGQDTLPVRTSYTNQRRDAVQNTQEDITEQLKCSHHSRNPSPHQRAVNLRRSSSAEGNEDVPWSSGSTEYEMNGTDVDSETDNKGGHFSTISNGGKVPPSEAPRRQLEMDEQYKDTVLVAERREKAHSRMETWDKRNRSSTKTASEQSDKSNSDLKRARTPKEPTAKSAWKNVTPSCTKPSQHSTSLSPSSTRSSPVTSSRYDEGGPDMYPWWQTPIKASGTTMTPRPMLQCSGESGPNYCTPCFCHPWMAHCTCYCSYLPYYASFMSTAAAGRLPPRLAYPMPHHAYLSMPTHCPVGEASCLECLMMNNVYRAPGLMPAWPALESPLLPGSVLAGGTAVWPPPSRLASSTIDKFALEYPGTLYRDSVIQTDTSPASSITSLQSGELPNELSQRGNVPINARGKRNSMSVHEFEAVYGKRLCPDGFFERPLDLSVRRY